MEASTVSTCRLRASAASRSSSSMAGLISTTVDPRAKAGQKRTVAAAAGAEAEHALTGHVAEPAGAVHGLHGVVEIRVDGRPCKTLAAPGRARPTRAGCDRVWGS